MTNDLDPERVREQLGRVHAKTWLDRSIVPPISPRFRSFVWGAAGFMVAAVLFGAFAWMRTAEPDEIVPPVSRFEVELESDGLLGSQVGTDVVLSPDGTRVVFVSRDAEGLAHVYTRRLDETDAERLPATEGARSVFVSPDGRWVGFWAAGRVKNTPVDGGEPVVLCEAGDLLGASWGEDGTIVAALNADGKLWRLPESGGTPEALLDLSADGRRPVWPQIVPNSGLVLYTVLAGDADSATIEALSLSDRKRTTLVRDGAFGRYLASGYLIYVNQGTVYAVTFDPAGRMVSGTPVSLLSGVSYSRTLGYAQLDVSQTGTLVYRRAAEAGLRTVAWLDRAGRSTPLLPKPGRYAWPRLSPDGQRLALSVTEGGASSIWVYDARTGETRHVPTGAADHSGLTWWPDGDLLLFGGLGGMASVRVDAEDGSRKLTSDEALAVPWSVSAGGEWLVYHEMSPATAFDLWTVPVTRTERGVQLGSAKRLLETPAIETMPTLSPDARWIAYVSNESGLPNVYVRRFPDGNESVRVSSAGGNGPKWSPKVRELLYRTIDRRVMATTYVIQNGRFVVGSSRLWAPQPLADTGVLPGFDLAPDGERIAALLPAARPADQLTSNHVTFVLNFAADVRRRATR